MIVVTIYVDTRRKSLVRIGKPTYFGPENNKILKTKPRLFLPVPPYVLLPPP